MTDEDIKRIVICREAIDKHRAFNRARVEAIAVSAKPSSITKAELEPERTKSTLEMMQVLKEQGFDSYDEFSNWYKKLILECYKECTPIEGECDGCEGLEIAECIKIYGGASACYNVRPKVPTEMIYTIALKARQSGNGKAIESGNFCCPKGHGFYLDVNKRKNPPDGIDFGWRV